MSRKNKIWYSPVMWQKEYRDYKKDEPLVKCKVEAGKGIVGCEMHELNGWGNTLHRRKQKHGTHLGDQHRVPPLS